MSNPFLTKKDPLLEAVRVAMQDGAIRRQAEELVNEEFGVYSRKAVVREDLAAYDARLEEAYKCMKEGEKPEKKEKKDDGKAEYSKMREKMVGKGKDAETTRKIVGEAKKLADKDYDKDGKVESPKDEVWGSRFRAAKMAGKMEETSHLSPKQKRMAALAGNPKKIDSSDLAALRNGKKMEEEQVEEEYEEAKKHAARVRRHGKKPTWEREGAWSKQMKRQQAAAERRRKSKTVSEEEQIDELYGRGKLDAAIQSHMTKKGYKRGEEKDGSPSYTKGPVKFSHSKKDPKDPKWRGWSKSEKGNAMSSSGNDPESSLPRIAKSMKEEQIDELKKPTPETAAKVVDRAVNRDEWSAKAANRLYKRYKDRYEKPEAKKEMNEAAYSAKAARAGKDIGKPGKSFSKIAAKAGEKYGSEERGKKVAGAILKRIRAKHMREESDAVSPKNDKESKGIIRSFDPDQNAAKEVRKGLEGSKGEIRDPKSDPNKYPGL
jgi:hypothetical protein